MKNSDEILKSINLNFSESIVDEFYIKYDASTSLLADFNI